MQNLLELSGVCKRYPSFSLRDVGFTLPAGSIMALIGENGAGKTTTIKLILNEIRRDAGSIRIFGRDGIRDETAVKEEIGVVFDESYFHRGLSSRACSAGGTPPCTAGPSSGSGCRAKRSSRTIPAA